MPFHNLTPDTLYYIPVDGSLLEKEQGWMKYENREPGCLQAFFDALQFATQNLDQKELTVAYIRTIHAICSERSSEHGEDRRGQYLIHPVHRIHIGAGDCSEAGLFEHLEEIESNYLKIREEWIEDNRPLEQLEQHYDLDVPGALIIDGQRIGATKLAELRQEWGCSDNAELARVVFKKINEHQFCELVLCLIPYNLMCGLIEIVENYNEGIGHADTPEAKLALIIKTIRRAERLHPFNDHNNRTFVNLLLTRLLLQNGFDAPVIFYRPNVFDMHSYEELTAIVIAGIENGKRLANGERIFEFDPATVPAADQARFRLLFDRFNADISREKQQENNRFLMKFTYEETLKIFPVKLAKYMDRCCQRDPSFDAEFTEGKNVWGEMMQILGTATKAYFQDESIPEVRSALKKLIEIFPVEQDSANAEIVKGDEDLVRLYKEIKVYYEALENYSLKTPQTATIATSPISQPCTTTTASAEYDRLRSQRQGLCDDAVLTDTPSPSL